MRARVWLENGFGGAAACGGVVASVLRRAGALLSGTGGEMTAAERNSSRLAIGVPYMRGLDGLRALGVIAVLLYHADVGWMRGGFLGVELFFVVSGFLITTLLLAEMRERGSIDVREFWLRRARRLLPTAFSVIGVTLAVTVVFLPDEVARLRGDALAGFAYVSNWFLIFNDQSYFESVGRPSPLLHLWSLAVEEQFYIVWPLVVTLIVGRLPKWGAYIVVLALAGASLGLMAYLYDPAVDPSRIYYGTDTRLGGLLIGAALAVLWSSGAARERIGRIPWQALDVMGVLALAGVCYAFFAIGEYDSRLYLGGFAAFGVVSALLIAVAAHPESRLASLVLSSRPLRWVGLRSYSIYLWHWPVFVFTRPGLDVQMDGLELLAVRIAIVVALAELSYRLVETPFRTGAVARFVVSLLQPGRASLRNVMVRWVAPASAASVVILFVGLSVVEAEPPEPPSYLSVGQVQTTSWSERTPTPAPQVTATPSPTERATPRPTATPAPPTSEPTAAETATPVATATSSPTETVAPTPAPTPEPAASAAPPAPAPEGRVFALGDSVMLGALAELSEHLGDVEVDAAVGRQAAEALEILRWRKQNGVLGDVVVLHIGNNGVVTQAQVDEALGLLSEVPRVAVVNVKVPRQWEGPNNEALASAVARYSNAVLVDWKGASGENQTLFRDDGLHLQPEGALLYAQTIAGSLSGPAGD